MGPTDELLEFPCDYPIKVMGRNDAEFRQLAVEIVERHYPVDTDAPREQASRNGRFLSLTFTVRAIDKVGLDALYRALTADKRFLMVL